jgi:hypothetical protein
VPGAQSESATQLWTGGAGSVEAPELFDDDSQMPFTQAAGTGQSELAAHTSRQSPLMQTEPEAHPWSVAQPRPLGPAHWVG